MLSSIPDLEVLTVMTLLLPVSAVFLLFSFVLGLEKANLRVSV